MKDKPISASKIGKMAWCPHGSSLQENGARVSSHSVKLSDQGTESHEQLTQAVISHGQQDKRCFVASFALGVDHPITQVLRDWRDQKLMVSTIGRLFVECYYGLSPAFVQLMGWLPGGKTVSGAVVVFVAKKITGAKL